MVFLTTDADTNAQTHVDGDRLNFELEIVIVRRGQFYSIVPIEWAT
jgi:hypothetical protein